MMVALYCTGPVPDLKFLGTEWDGISIQAVGSQQQFSSLLYRDPDFIGLLHVDRPVGAEQIVRGMRLGNIKSRLLVLLKEFGEPAAQATARAEVLRAGADDAQPDTIDPLELVARIRSVAERGDYLDHERIPLPGGTFTSAAGGIEVDDGRYVHMSEKLCQIMVELARRPGETRTKQQIMDALYGGEVEPEIKIVDVMICKLRHKVMEATGGLDVIETVWGRGYRFVPEGFRPEMSMKRSRMVR